MEPHSVQATAQNYVESLWRAKQEIQREKWCNDAKRIEHY